MLTPWEHPLMPAIRAINDRRNTASVGAEINRKIDRALADVGMDPSARWVWATTARHELAGQGFVSGQLVVPSHIVGRQGRFPFWFATEYPQDKNHRNYYIEVFGRQIRSAEEAQQCPREAVWCMTVEEDPAMDGPGTLELAVWQSQVHHRAARIYGCADWRPGWQEIDYSYGGVVPGGDNDTTAADKGLKLLRDIPISAGGRHRKEEAEVRATVDPIVRSLKAQRIDPTEERVAEHLPRKRGRERNPRVLRRWINDILKLEWREYVNSVDPANS